MSRKSREAAKRLKRRSGHTACTRETKQKKLKSMNIGKGYKMMYHGSVTKKHGV